MIDTMADDVVAIAQDMFSAMVDGESGALIDRPGDAAVLTAPVQAWVEIRGERSLRTLVATGRDTADRLTRALLVLEPQEAVEVDDVRDALGEIANVIGGNVKGLLPEHTALSLPVVSFDGRCPDGALLWTRSLQWHHEPLVVSMLWDVPEKQEEQL